MRSLPQQIFEVVSSLKLTCVLLVLLGLLTWLGTLEQVDHGIYVVQKKYFESLVLVYRWGFLGIPLPGGYLVMALLALNLICGGIVRMRKSASRAGILVTHLGIGLLLLTGAVKKHMSDYGHLTLYPGERGSQFQDYHLWEIAISRQLDDGKIQEFLIPHDDFVDQTGTVRFTSPEIPFDLEVRGFMPNSIPQQVGGQFELRPWNIQAEDPIPAPGLYARVIETGGNGHGSKKHDGILWGFDFEASAAAPDMPWTITTMDGQVWGINLRHKRYQMPFTIEVERFTKENHPRIDSPKWFSSDILVIDEEAAPRKVLVFMNNPLRQDGHVVYQASYGPPDAPQGTRLYTSLAVSRNPSDQFPLIACLVIALGLIVQFTNKLMRYIRSEAKKAT